MLMPTAHNKQKYNVVMLGDNREGKCSKDFGDICKELKYLRRNFEQVKCGYNHSLALKQKGILYSWG